MPEPDLVCGLIANTMSLDEDRLGLPEGAPNLSLALPAPWFYWLPGDRCRVGTRRFPRVAP